MSWLLLYAKLAYFLKDFWLYLLLIFLSFIIFIFAAWKVFRSQKSETAKRLLLVGAFSFFILVLIYSGFEAYFRYRFDESDSLGFLKINNKWMDRHVVYNNYFFRDRNFEAKKEKGRTRIGVVGDSLTFGYGIKDANHRFSDVLEKKLRASGRDVEVYNLGKPGYDTWNEIEEFKKVKHLKFDIIVWEYYLNDAEGMKSAGTKVLVRERAQSKLAASISNFSYFFDYIYWRLAARYEKTFVELRQADMEAYRDKENFTLHRKEVDTFASLLKEDNRKVIVVVFPFFKFLPQNPLSDMYPKIKRMFSENGLPVIDLYQDLKNKNGSDVLVSRYDYHPNESVQNIVADKLYGTIAPLIPKK